MTTFIASIAGVTPLLMHRWGEQNETEESSRAIHIQRRDPRQEAERVTYRREDGTIYLPGAAIARTLREAGAAHKQRGSRRSLKYVIPAAVLVMEDDISLLDADGGPLTTFEVDSRPVVIPATKGRIMRHRPRFNSWHAEFSLEVDLGMIEADLVHQLLVESGTRLGLLDYRPEKGGPFGRFSVVSWKELAAKVPTGKRLRAVVAQ